MTFIYSVLDTKLSVFDEKMRKVAFNDFVIINKSKSRFIKLSIKVL